MDNQLSVQNLRFGYDRKCTVLDGISFSVPDGEITALLGANGSGKSTLFHLLTGRLKPQGGEITFCGRNIETIRRREYAQKIAVVNQYNTAPEDMTVRRLVEMGRTPYRKFLNLSESGADKDAVEAAMDFTDTRKFADRNISSLSGGQKQRVWLALALAQSPEILLLDEITTYLDIRYQYEMLKLIRRLNSEKNLTVVMVLHDINQAIAFSDNTVMMKNGKIIASGKTNEVISEKNLAVTFDVQTKITKIDGRTFCLIDN